MSDHENNWYQRTHEFLPFTRAEGKAVSDEFDAIQASFEKIPKMRGDGLGFAISPIIPTPTKDNHPVTYGMVKNAESSILASKETVLRKAQEVEDNTLSVNNDKMAVEKARDLTFSYKTNAENAAEIATTKAQEAEQSANIAILNRNEIVSDAQRTATLASQAEESEGLAKKWASNPEDETVSQGLFSAFHYANKARKYAERTNNLNGGKKYWSDILDIPQASLENKGIVKLSSELDNESEDIAATVKASKNLKSFIDVLTRSFENCITNSKKSNAVDSTSSDTVATSFAVKTAYDVANAKQSPSTTLAGYGINDFKIEKYRGDLNDLRTDGHYFIGSKHDITNSPTGAGTGNIIVNAGGNPNACHQLYLEHYSSNIFERHQTNYVNNQWSEWKKSYSIETLGELDLNNVKGIGSYGQVLTSLATASRHYPFQEAGSLLVSPSAYGCQQEYTTYFSNQKFIRNQNGDATTNWRGTLWTEWKKITTEIKILTGTISHGGTIPLPSGFSENECKWFVSINNSDKNNSLLLIVDYYNSFKLECWTSGRNVHARMVRRDFSGDVHYDMTANYIIIGVK